MQSNASRIELIASLPDSTRSEFLSGLTGAEALNLLFDWEYWARPSQLPPPGEWDVCFYCAGRGSGKTRAGAEWTRDRVESEDPGIGRRIALVAETPADARDTMVEGESGMLAVCPPWNLPDYEPSKRQLTWTNPAFPSYGAIGKIFTSAEPAWLRGPEHDTVWADEIAAWRYPRETWDNLVMGLRLGDDPRAFATSTPKPIELVRELLEDDDVVKLRGTTWENAANLPPAFLARLVKKYGGTRTGRQELEAELLEDAEGALWKRAWLDATRTSRVDEDLKLSRLLVAVDPAVTSKETSDETGIVVGALGEDDFGYLLADRSGRWTPKEWADHAIDLFLEYAADEIVAEANNGGDLVTENIKTRARERKIAVPVRKIIASRGKRTRAEPIAMLSESGRIRHVGSFPALEDQLCTWEPGTGRASPDRLDAYVWAFSRLLVKPGQVAQRRASHW